MTAADVMDAQEVAELLHIPMSTVEDLARREEMPSQKVGKHRRYLRWQIEAFLIGDSA